VASSEMEQLASVAFLTPERKVVLVVSARENRLRFGMLSNQILFQKEDAK